MAENQSVEQEVQMDENSPHASRDNPMLSSRSDYQPPPNMNPDLALITPSEEKLLYQKNHFVDFEHLNIDPLELDILNGHPLHYALVGRIVVPLIYLQQAWSLSLEILKFHNLRSRLITTNQSWITRN
ncbi:hypothetical protein L6452_15126 [Arctium lappa]|uniref:Uncharacterized protein n=1 Tax=Arctium lappa TaxID=4217 RepID=A0ACB9CMX1_ARCLA|nr:hypothetical protein L6452_15126 [Arctium lappa]